MKQKTFIIYGSNTDSLINNKKDEDYLFSPKILGKYTEIIEIGDKKHGVKPTELEDIFKEYLVDNHEPLNIILIMHGTINENGKYYLQNHDKFLPFEEICKGDALKDKTSEEIKKWQEEYSNNPIYLPELIESRELLEILTKVTKGMPLNIIANSCYGAKLHQEASVLPIGSKVFSLSSDDRMTNNEDLYNKKLLSIAEIIFRENFTLEGLIETYCLSQKYTNNTPVITKVGENGVQIINIADYTNNLSKEQFQAKWSETFSKLSSVGIIEQAHIMELINNLSNGKNISEYKTPDKILDKLLQHYNNGTLAEFVQTLNTDYYEQGTFKSEMFISTLDNYNNLINVLELSKEMLDLPAYQNAVGIYNAVKLTELENKLTTGTHTKSQLGAQYLELVEDYKLKVEATLENGEYAYTDEDLMQLKGNIDTTYEQFKEYVGICKDTENQRDLMLLLKEKGEYIWNICQFEGRINSEKSKNEGTPAIITMDEEISSLSNYSQLLAYGMDHLINLSGSNIDDSDNIV